VLKDIRLLWGSISVVWVTTPPDNVKEVSEFIWHWRDHVTYARVYEGKLLGRVVEVSTGD
jgi:hypothetical protein